MTGGGSRCVSVAVAVSQPPNLESELARLQSELELSRRELADARARLEDALEQLAVERDRWRVAEEQAAAERPAEARTPVLGRLSERLRRQTP